MAICIKSHKKKKMFVILFHFTIPFLGIYHREVNRLSQGDLCTRRLHCLVIYNSIETGKKCLALKD